ncbi:MAG TPA: hypothetical protein VIJ94_10280 [Caulobacteraceae bacterium]
MPKPDPFAPFAPWKGNLSDKEIQLDFMGGLLVVARDAEGKLFAQWQGEIQHPEEFMDLPVHAEAKAEGVTSSKPLISAFLHFLPNVAAAADYAPGAIRSHIRQAYPHHYELFKHDQHPGLILDPEGTVAPADPF